MQIDWSWLVLSPSAPLMIAVTALGMYAALVLFTRLAGLRSFSKISSFDFATTVAFGSILASAVLSDDPPLLQAVIALGMIYALQQAVTRLRIYSPIAARVVDNPPMLIMAHGTVLHENLAKAGVTEDDLRAKLREANILQWDEVRAVVVESTGDVSVLHGPTDGSPLDPSLLSGVRDATRLEGRG